MHADALFLGVDGGGTGCRARLVDAEGHVLGEGHAGPATTRLGIDKSWAAIEVAFRQAIEAAGVPSEDLTRVHLGVGLAGITRKGSREALRTIIHPFASASFTSDALIACIGAHGGADGGIVIVGTGSCGAAVVQGREIQLGGYGFPISDEGSGARLGLGALQRAMLAHDGRLERTPLLEALLGRFEHDAQAVIGWMDGASATDYAALAPLIVAHANAGDPMARRLMREAADAIALTCRALLDMGAPRLCLLGGLADVIAGWLSPDLKQRLEPRLGDALDGAVLFARRGG
ncbi:BadF/BadG/BcrA/BcrD ATPase family protein [Consotaella aegiceratis]|uniref:BadF/BadG/BcrA/BcrD ATPase family protein n=1 Tax=Consotaella aegiceratis TaxID=3097961 RepID=UPI002F428321